MVFAPAIGIAACQVLAALCGFVAVLFVILGAKNGINGDGMGPAQAFLLAAVFVGGALVCLWFAKVIRRLARGE